MKRYILAALPAAVLAACATAGSAGADEAAARLAEFDRTGRTESCLGLRQISQIEPLSEQQFLVRVGASEYWLNDVNGKCNDAHRSFTRLQYTTTLSQLCRGEIISVVDNSSGFTVGSCSLGTYHELKKKPE